MLYLVAVVCYQITGDRLGDGKIDCSEGSMFLFCGFRKYFRYLALNFNLGV
jgi:hypothetical protein